MENVPLTTILMHIVRCCTFKKIGDNALILGDIDYFFSPWRMRRRLLLIGFIDLVS